MAKMKPRRKAKSVQEDGGGPNWLVIGSIIGVAALALIGLAVTATLNPPEAAEPTPVLEEVIGNAAGYCESNPERCISVGNPNAEVTMVEIVDYGCPHCASFNAETAPSLLNNYVETDLVHWMVMPFALGAQSQPSAESVLCAAEQGSELALEYHEDLFLLQGTGDVHTRGGFLSVANRVDGMDVDAFESCLDDSRYSTDVSFNQQAARQLGVSSTPSFFLNNRLISGNQEIGVFQAQFDTALN
ncbi:MAG: thioredoxin domain-containing protein [Chloroflexota bacterium]